MSEAPREADLSIGEHAAGGHIPGRPVSWAVVVLVCGGFIAGGIGLILALPWLFIAGMAVVFVGAIIGWATHAMADVTARVETRARRANAAELGRAEAATAVPAIVEPAESATAAPASDAPTDAAARDSDEASVS